MPDSDADSDANRTSTGQQRREAHPGQEPVGRVRVEGQTNEKMTGVGPGDQQGRSRSQGPGGWVVLDALGRLPDVLWIRRCLRPDDAEEAL
eukprot:3412784-Rhodomonas_salina.5